MRPFMKFFLILFSSLFFTCLSFAQVNRNIVLEEFSTAPCGACPDGRVVADELLDKHDNLIVITHHSGFGIDSMTIPESPALSSLYTNGAPTAAINRTFFDTPTIYLNETGMVWSRQRWDSVITAESLKPAAGKVIVTPHYDSESRTLDVDLLFLLFDDMEAGDLRFNLSIVEDSVVGLGPGYDQTNYYNESVGHPMYGLGNPIVGYDHRHVLRDMLGDTWGTAGVLPEGPQNGDVLSHSYSYVIPEEWNADKISLVGWVNYYDETDFTKHAIVNANQVALLAGIVDIEEVEAAFINMKLSPNPVNDQLSLYCKNASNTNPMKIEVMNTQGQLLYTQKIYSDTIELDVSRWSAGSYYVRLTNKQQRVAVSKIIKL